MTSELPYPVNHGGLMAAHAVIQAIAESAPVSVLVLTSRRYAPEVVRQAQDYYQEIGATLICHQFASLEPSSAPLVKAWHYLSGYPRHGFWSADADGLVAEQIRKTGSELVWCNTTHEAKYLPTAKRLGCKTVLTTQNIESDLARQTMRDNTGISRVAGWVRWIDLRRLERMGARLADVVTAITSCDQEYYLRLKSSDSVFVLPFGYPVNNGADCCNRTAEEPNTVCFVGSMDWPHNVKAARYLVKQIMPLVWNQVPTARAFLVGKKPTEEVQRLASDRVIVTGTVPSVREYYDRAPVVVVPMIGVAGIKVKLVEAMAYGKAVVSTPDGAAGIGVEDGKQLIVADEPETFADAVVKLFHDNNRRQRLGADARCFVAERFSPKATKRQVEHIIDYTKRLPVAVAKNTNGAGAVN